MGEFLCHFLGETAGALPCERQQLHVYHIRLDFIRLLSLWNAKTLLNSREWSAPVKSLTEQCNQPTRLWRRSDGKAPHGKASEIEINSMYYLTQESTAQDLLASSCSLYREGLGDAGFI